jgi:hypothetical protein
MTNRLSLGKSHLRKELTNRDHNQMEFLSPSMGKAFRPSYRHDIAVKECVYISLETGVVRKKMYLPSRDREVADKTYSVV